MNWRKKFSPQSCAPVAQGIEQQIPNLLAACSIHAGGTPNGDAVSFNQAYGPYRQVLFNTILSEVKQW